MMETELVLTCVFRAMFRVMQSNTDDRLERLQTTVEQFMTSQTQEAAATRAAFEALRTAVTSKLSDLQSQIAGAVSSHGDDLSPEGRQAFDSLIADMNTFTQTVGGTTAPGEAPSGNTPGGPGTGTDVAVAVDTQTGGTSTSTMDGAPSTGSSATDNSGTQGTDVTKQEPDAPEGEEVKL